MTTLYVQEQGAHVRKKDNQIIVTKDGQTLEEVPLAQLEQVVLMGRGVQMSTALLVALIERGVPVTLTNQHGNRHYATLTGGPSRFGELRTRQMFLMMTPASALLLARQVIAAKLHNQRALLGRTGWPSAPSAMAQIAQALAAVEQAATIDSVRGYERSRLLRRVAGGAALGLELRRSRLSPAAGPDQRRAVLRLHPGAA